MRRILFALAIVGLFVNTASALDGSGTQQDPWRIESLADFNEFAADANYWDDYTRLETDVNLAGLDYYIAVIAPDLDSLTPGFQGTAFTGVFDGNDHIIRSLVIQQPANDYVGLFGKVGQNGQLHNISVENIKTTGREHVGSLVGGNKGSLTTCYTSGSVRGVGYIGGLAGHNWSGRLDNCHAAGSVSGEFFVGGLTGDNTAGSLTACYAIGLVSGDDYIGGLVGDNYIGSINTCYATGLVSGDWYVGGLLGHNWSVGHLDNCYATGPVSGDQYVGGLLGGNRDGMITNCYSTGNVDGNDYIGGLIGCNDYGTVTDSFWDVNTSGINISYGGTGKTTVEMRTKSTFTEAGWDFVEIWNIGENQTYPYLRIHPAGDINHDDIVNMLDFATFAGHWLESKGN
jgi:hypothetical protein